MPSTNPLPNIKRMFVPDPGYVLIEGDLKGADARVVAWEANDAELKKAFNSGLDIHSFNAEALTRIAGRPISRHLAKTGVHAVNYGAKERTLGEHLGLTTADARLFINQWFRLHPNIAEWHRKIEFDLRTKHCVYNKFGYRRFYFDRPDQLLPQALAWIGQSTTALTISSAMLNIDDNLPWVQLLAQVHDSLLMQVPAHMFPACVTPIREQMTVTVPYADPLIMPVDFKWSPISWGDCKEYKEAA